MFHQTFEIEGSDSLKGAAQTVIAALEDDGMLVQTLHLINTIAPAPEGVEDPDELQDIFVITAGFVPAPEVCGDLHRWLDSECEAFLVQGDHGEWFCPDRVEHYTGGESDIY